MDTSPAIKLEKIVSGGQTGVDRAALDAAIEVSMPHGGWCPKGRKAEDGEIPACYLLQETGSKKYPPRTRRNVEDSCGTLILYCGDLTGGSALTQQIAMRVEKPCFVVDLWSDPDVQEVCDWITGRELRTLNVAGPRESNVPGIAQEARAFLRGVLRTLGAGN